VSPQEASESLVPNLISYWYADMDDARPNIGLLRAAAYFLWRATTNRGVVDGERIVVDIKGRSAIIQEVEPMFLRQMKVRKAVDLLLRELEVEGVPSGS
jgi:hypothetical protein